MEVVISCGTSTEDNSGLAWDLSNGSILSTFKPNACAPNCLTCISVPCPVSQSTTTTITNTTIAHNSSLQQSLTYHNNTPLEPTSTTTTTNNTTTTTTKSTTTSTSNGPKGIQGRTHKRHEIGSTHTTLSSSYYLPHTFTIAGAQSIPLKQSKIAASSSSQLSKQSGAAASYAPTKIIQFWNWRKEQPVLRCPTSEAITSLLSLPSQPPLLAAGTSAGTVLLWNTLSGALVATWEAHIKKVSALAASPDGGILITGSDDATVAVWSVAAVTAAQSASVRSVTPVRLWSLHSLGVTGVAVCGGTNSGAAGGRIRVVSTSLDHTVRVWDVNSGDCLSAFTMPSFVTCVGCDPCGRFCVVGCGNSLLYRINLVKFNNSINNNNISSSSSSSSSVSNTVTTVDSNGNNTTVLSFNESHDQLTYEGHNRPITSIAVNKNGSRVVSSSLDGAVIVWDTLSRQPILKFTGHNGPVNCVVIAPLPEVIVEPNAAVLPIVPLKKVLSQNPLAPAQFSVSQAFASNPANAKKRSRDEEAADAKIMGGVPLYVLPEVQFGVNEIWGENNTGDGCSVEEALDAMVDEAVRTEAEIERAKEEGAKVDSVKTLEKMLAEARTSEARWKAAANNLYQLSLKQAMSSDNTK